MNAPKEPSVTIRGSPTSWFIVSLERKMCLPLDCILQLNAGGVKFRPCRDKATIDRIKYSDEVVFFNITQINVEKSAVILK
jgi:hypothetical protein